MKKYEKIVNTFIIGCICLILTGGTLRAQERQVIALSQTTMRTGDVLKEIEAKSPYKVSANLEMLDINRVVQFDRTDGSVQEIVAQLLSGTPNQYQITRGVVIITPSRPQPASSASQEPTFVTPGVPERQPRAVRTPRPAYVDEPSQQQEVPRESFTPIYVQAYEPEMTNPPSAVALKTNLLYAATLTPNLAVEFGLGRKTTLDIGGGYNSYEPDNGKRWKHWLVQPEFRYWFCERFNGAFVGIHALGGEYSVAKVDFPFNVFDDSKDFRYEGEYYGGGLVFGYQWILGKRWNLELAIGAGYARVGYDKYPCAECGTLHDRGHKNYFGPTKASFSLLFFL